MHYPYKVFENLDIFDESAFIEDAQTEIIYFSIMLKLLKENSLQVLIKYSNEETYCSCGKRLVVSYNTSWYSYFCSCFLSGCKSHKRRYSKHDTKIKRKNITILLTKLSKGMYVKSKYVLPLRVIARCLYDYDYELEQNSYSFYYRS